MLGLEAAFSRRFWFIKTRWWQIGLTTVLALNGMQSDYGLHCQRIRQTFSQMTATSGNW
jgi:hypothetical protein